MIDSEDYFDIESDNFEVEKDISAVESGEVENNDNQEESRKDMTTLMIKIVMEEDGSEQETKLITESQVKVKVPIQLYQTTHWKVLMKRLMLRC